MARIAGINIPQNKVVSIALTYIHGIGAYSSKKICKELNIPSSKRVNELSEEQVLKIREFIDANHKVEGDLRREVSVNIKRFINYEKNIIPVIDFYKQSNLLKVINGEASISAISGEIIGLIEGIKG